MSDRIECLRNVKFHEVYPINLLVSETSDVNVVDKQIMDDVVDYHPPACKDIRTEIMRLKNNKSEDDEGLQAEMFKTGDGELLKCIYQFFDKQQLILQTGEAVPVGEICNTHWVKP